MRVRSLRWRNEDFRNQWDETVLDRWTYSDFHTAPAWKDGWISFDCAVCRPGDDRVYLGVTCFDANNILLAFDRKKDRFVELGYARVADAFDAKFHRSLVLGRDGAIYGAPALLHCCDRYLEAPGAAVVRYDPASDEIAKIGTPLEHVYVQSFLLDSRNETAYCLCFAPEYLISYDLGTREMSILGLLGSGYGGMTQGENIALDDNGNVWCNWSLTRAWQDAPGPDAVRLAKYIPSEGRMHYYQHGLPLPTGTNHAFARPEAWFNLGDGMMYASGANGSLYRIDPDTGKAEYLFTPVSDRPSRLASLATVDDNVAYGIVGREGRCELLRVHFREGRYDLLGPIEDDEGHRMFQCHDIVATEDGVLFACENDNPYRSSFLWEITV